MKHIVWVGIGGFVGAVLRYKTSGLMIRYTARNAFPAATFVVNAVGCLVTGILMALAVVAGSLGTARLLGMALHGASAYNRGQVLYRIGEMLEGRRDQFVAELTRQGVNRRRAESETDAAIDRLVYYAGWSDKYQQIFSAVNPVASSHFNFSVLEPTGVVAIVAPEESGLLGLVSNLAPAIVGGNTCVVLASESRPLAAISFAEVLHSSDVPAGVVNLLTGFRSELTAQFASHMDVNAVVFCEAGDGDAAEIQHAAADNMKRVVDRTGTDWRRAAAQGPYFIRDTQEVKTTWHPIGG